jgi:site-specific recombinase XerD
MARFAVWMSQINWRLRCGVYSWNERLRPSGEDGLNCLNGVFCSEAGTALHKSGFERRVFHKLLAKSGLRRIRFHDLRHTFASRLIQNGESLVYIKEQMGHHSIQVTVDIYGHLVPGANRAAVNRLDDEGEGATSRNPDATRDTGPVESGAAIV